MVRGIGLYQADRINSVRTDASLCGQTQADRIIVFVVETINVEGVRIAVDEGHVAKREARFLSADAAHSIECAVILEQAVENGHNRVLLDVYCTSHTLVSPHCGVTAEQAAINGHDCVRIDRDSTS